ncbi:MAG: Arylsulfatase precursor [Verrucomicrobiota bacterium]
MLRPTILGLLALPLLAAAPLHAKSPVALPARPNIIFILSDDIAQGDIGVYGQKIIQTPRLDRMAREGTRYTQAYCGTTVCAPSRTSLLTGLHSGHSPVRGNREATRNDPKIPVEGQFPLPAETVTVAQILKTAGYATAVMGKWGMGMFETTGSPLKKGFDHQFGYNCQRHAHSYFPTYLYDDGVRFELPGNTGTGVGPIYAQNLIQADVLKWVREKKDQPFFLYYALTLPHFNHEIDSLGLYADKPWPAEQKAYAAQVTRLDRDVGQLLDLLDELKLDEKTLVIFAGDNGSSFEPSSPMGKLFNQAGNGLRGYKRDLYEGALRQAALARWPGVVPSGRVTDEPWSFWDFLPTAVELAGSRPPAGYKTDGLSLVSFLRGGSAPKRDYFYWELHEGEKPLQAVRFGDWKAVRNGPGRFLELYDLGTDAAEKYNLAAAQPELVARAESLMNTAHTDDPNWPLTKSSK